MTAAVMKRPTGDGLGGFHGFGVLQLSASGDELEILPDRLEVIPDRLEVIRDTPHAAALVAKRCLDASVALLLILLVLPVLVLTAIAVRATTRGPVLFRQPRVGRGGRPFTMLKFRTFPVDHVDDVHSRPLSECPTRFGRFIRRTSIDELPQLLNVLRGDMSLVGPRPERPHFVEELQDVIPGYRNRHRVLGGITGLAQVEGYWGESDLVKRIALDNAYIDSWSLRSDLGILLRTIPAVARKARG